MYPEALVHLEVQLHPEVPEHLEVPEVPYHQRDPEHPEIPEVLAAQLVPDNLLALEAQLVLDKLYNKIAPDCHSNHNFS